jgi:hypothetical protein
VARTAKRAIAIALVAAAPLGLSVPLAGAAQRRCEDVQYRLPDGTIYAQTFRLRATRTSCRTAGRVALGWLRGAEGTVDPPRPLGYRCVPGERTTTCRRGARVVRWDVARSR